MLTDYWAGTVKALPNLHRSGYAHNDVRIENICFREEDREIFLIDLERRREVGEKCVYEFGSYERVAAGGGGDQTFSGA